MATIRSFDDDVETGLLMNQPKWRFWARRFATAAMLTLGQLSVPIGGHLRTRPAVVRLIDRRRRGRFDPRELVKPDVVLTVPLTLDEQTEKTATDRLPIHLN